MVGIRYCSPHFRNILVTELLPEMQTKKVAGLQLRTLKNWTLTNFALPSQCFKPEPDRLDPKLA